MTYGFFRRSFRIASIGMVLWMFNFQGYADPLERFLKKQDVGADWFHSLEGRRAVSQVVAFQNPSGGWNKNIDMISPMSEKDIEQKKGTKDYSTIDNGSTYTQLRFLAMAYNATRNETVLDAFLHGMDYLFETQYANGGWPVFSHRKGSYYSVIHFNDNSIVGVLELMKEIVDGNALYGFVPDVYQEKAERSLQAGIDCILKTQIRVGENLTVWCAQHDPVTLLPAKARAYELPSLSGGESAGITLFLMSLDHPSKEIKESVRSAVQWFEDRKIEGIRVEETVVNGEDDKVVVEDPNAEPVWARFYDILSNQPFFCGRDGIKRSKLSEIEQERRGGYAYYVTSPKKVLRRFAEWNRKWCTTNNSAQ